MGAVADAVLERRQNEIALEVGDGADVTASAASVVA
jgi:hypothetical protein